MELDEKESYEAPTTVVVEAHPEGIICGSGGPYKGFRHDGSGHEDYEW